MLKSYLPTKWIGGKTIGTADVMNNIEEGIVNAHQKIGELDSQIKEIAKGTSIEDGKLYLLKSDGTKIGEGTTLPTSMFTDVKEFGVVGDGITDDTKAMQRALDRGGNLYLPDTYLINGELKVKSNTHLLGVPNKTMFKKSQPKYIREIDSSERWTVHLLVGNYGIANSCENVVIENIILDGNSGRSTNTAYDKPEYGDSESGAKLLECVNADNVTIRNVVCQNNNYLGCSFVSCRNVFVENFKSINCDVGICLLKDGKTDTELRNYTFENIYIDGHDYSEGVSLYAKCRIYDVKMNNITILNKARGTGLLVGTEYSGEYGVVGGRISNVVVDGSAIGMAISQDAYNVQVNNVNIKNCTRGMIVSQTSHDNQITNVNISDIKSHGLYVGTNTYDNILSNINIRNCNTSNSSDYNQSYIICNGTKCICDNISIVDESSSRQYGLVVTGDENKFSFKNITKDTEKFQFYAITRQGDGNVPKNNIINVNSTKYHKCVDPSANYTTSITNVFNSSYNQLYSKSITTGSVSFSDTIFDKYKLNLTNRSTTIDLNNITLFEQYKRIFVTISVTGIDSSVTLATGGNIVWKTNDTLTTGQTTNHELLCINNQWIEVNRY